MCISKILKKKTVTCHHNLGVMDQGGWAPSYPINWAHSGRSLCVFRLALCHTWSAWMFAPLCSAEIAAPMVTLKHRWDVDTFSSAVPYQSPTHLVCNEKHLCTNLFVTIHWRDDLSSCHALVAAWCLKNMASQKFQTARLAGRSRCALASDYGNKVSRRRQKSTAISKKNIYIMTIPQR